MTKEQTEANGYKKWCERFESLLQAIINGENIKDEKVNWLIEQLLKEYRQWLK